MNKKKLIDLIKLVWEKISRLCNKGEQLAEYSSRKRKREKGKNGNKLNLEIKINSGFSRYLNENVIIDEKF